MPSLPILLHISHIYVHGSSPSQPSRVSSNSTLKECPFLAVGREQEGLVASEKVLVNENKQPTAVAHTKKEERLARLKDQNERLGKRISRVFSVRSRN